MELETAQSHGTTQGTLARREKMRSIEEAEETQLGHTLHSQSSTTTTTTNVPYRRRRRLGRKKRSSSTKSKLQKNACGECDEDKIGIERRITTLQKIVPGGESLGVDKLFEETACYILSLQCQVNAMKLLANFFEGLEKENNKFGG
ncbi:PREDICTED: transcription factor PAR2-like [Nelumbo nucifera]|uniref:Transcription factor PAR2-like n=1 Tax=Nelumbo nucifera TaxID=4432 RepID=A0A1U8AYU6_NELNU|nr:PREDICTED: transcription factor PAR2-like [Nelumbo nucifera]